MPRHCLSRRLVRRGHGPHVLPYVADIDRAVAEAARVLRPGGRFLATTNGACTMPEYWAYLERAAARFPGLMNTEPITDRFSLEGGPALLAPHLGGVETHTLHGTLRFLPPSHSSTMWPAPGRDTMRPGHTDAEWQRSST